MIKHWWSLFVTFCSIIAVFMMIFTHDLEWGIVGLYLLISSLGMDIFQTKGGEVWTSSK